MNIEIDSLWGELSYEGGDSHYFKVYLVIGRCTGVGVSIKNVPIIGFLADFWHKDFDLFILGFQISIF